MEHKPAYEELEGRVKELEKVAREHSTIEQELRKSEELHRIILTNLSDTVLITNKAGSFTYVCPNVNIIFGFSQDEVLALGNVAGLLGDKLVEPDDVEAREEIQNIEKEISDKWGKKHTLLVNVKRVSVNGGTLLYACRDITARKKAEEALKKSYDELEERVRERTTELTKINDILKAEIEERKQVEEALRTSEAQKKAILDASIDRIRYVDQEMRIIWANQASARGTTLSAEGLIGKPCYEIYVGIDSPCHGCPTMNAMETGRIERAIMHYPEVVGMGGEKYWDSYCVPLKNEAGDIDSFVQVSRDITDQKDAEEQIHSLTRELIKAHESERQIISRELHDSIAQDLSSLRITCETLFDSEPEISTQVKEKVSEMSQTLFRAIKEVRDLSYDLRPPGLDELGLVEVISQYSEDFAEKTGIKADFHSAGMESFNLDFDTEINLYRLTQEALNNVLKHSDAGHAEINLIADYPYISLNIQDDGKGFDVEKHLAKMKHEKRMGLRSMMERVRLLGGEMTIRSESMQGTKISIRIPCREKESGSKENHIDY